MESSKDREGKIKTKQLGKVNYNTDFKVLIIFMQNPGNS